MKIALISYEYPPDTPGGGIGTYTFQAACCLASRGHAVEVFAASPQREGTFEEGGIRLNLTRTTDLVRFAEQVLPAFSSRHREVDFDVVESPDYYSDGRCIRAAFPRLAHIVKLHTPLQLIHELAVAEPTMLGSLRFYSGQIGFAVQRLMEGKRPYRMTRFQPQTPVFTPLENVERDNAASAHLIVSPSISMGKWAEAKWGIESHRIRIVPSPFRPAPELLECSYPASNNKVGYFGRLEHRKGIEDLGTAIPLVLNRAPQTQFRLIGKAHRHPGTQEFYDVFLKRRLKRQTGAVNFVGRVPLESMPAEYGKIAISVIPSIWENFGYVCVEAMAAGRAIVATSGGGMEELLEGGRHGVLVAPRSPQALAEGLLSLLTNPTRCAELGASARRRVLEAYGYDSVGPQMETSYREAMEIAG